MNDAPKIGQISSYLQFSEWIQIWTYKCIEVQTDLQQQVTRCVLTSDVYIWKFLNLTIKFDESTEENCVYNIVSRIEKCTLHPWLKGKLIMI